MNYEELVEKARENYESEDTPHVVKAWLLANIIGPAGESEDEKNIKELISELKCSLRAAICQNDACGGGHEKRIALLEWGIAWLEKQGEKKSADEVLKIRQQLYQSGYNDGYKHGQEDIAISSEKKSIKADVDADEVIAWLDEHVPTKFEDMQNYVNQFKKDFGL